MKGKFARNFSPNSITKIKLDKFYSNFLRNDIKTKNSGRKKVNVFSAFRDRNCIDFYYLGGKLFGYDDINGFYTHFKYASVLDKKKNDYIFDSDLKNYSLIKNFSQNYNRIKENCSLYSGLESIGASLIYHKFPYTLPGSDIVVLDIEISFKSLENKYDDFAEGENSQKDIEGILSDNLHERKYKQDRIDLLLYNTLTKKLKFVELKHFSNKELTNKVNNIPKVYSQIKRYEKQINAKKNDILQEYNKYIIAAEDLFELRLRKPLSDVCDDVTLFIFGYDKDQEKGKLKEILKSLKGLRCYYKGNVNSLNINALWNAKILK